MGDLSQLTPGSGYEVKVEQAVTFCYGNHCALNATVPSPTSPPPPSPPSPPSPCGCKQGCNHYKVQLRTFSVWATIGGNEQCVENAGTCSFELGGGYIVPCQTSHNDSPSANCFTPCASPTLFLPSPPPPSPSPPPPSPSPPPPSPSPPPPSPSPPITLTRDARDDVGPLDDFASA